MKEENELGGGPKFIRYFAPTISALKEFGGSAHPSEVRDWIAAHLGISDEEQAELLASGRAARFANQVAWARFYLVKAGVLDASQRGIWALTEDGRTLPELTASGSIDLFHRVRKQFSGKLEEDVVVAPPEEEPASSELDHRAQVMELLHALPAAGFERFAQRLLRKSGFERVAVTGHSNDGGIDGIGILEVNPLVSFKVLFQCKRYKGSVGPDTVRDFRGAMGGRADKGIILTTGTFTSSARSESVRDGVPPIELVDGDKLVDMLENLELGLKPVRTYRVDQSFFDEFRS